MNPERTLSSGQVAKRLGVTVRTVHRWEDAGRLHPVRLATSQRRFNHPNQHKLTRGALRRWA